MKLRKIIERPLFAFWTLAALVTLILAALHPLDGGRWLMFAVCLFGVALYFPFPGTTRVRKTIIVERPVNAVYDFLSRPNNLQIWNPRVGAAQPSNIPPEVGQEWTYSPGRWLFMKAPSSLRHAFSKVDPPNMIEITASGRGLRASYAYILRDLGPRSEVTLDARVTGMPAVVAWLSSATARLYPSRDLARLKQALELGGSTKDPSPSQ
jgi:hypothetical protein